MTFKEERWSSLEEIVLGLSVKLINAQLEHLQTPGSLLTRKQIFKYIYFQLNLQNKRFK